MDLEQTADLRDTRESALLVDFDPRGRRESFLEPGVAYSVGGIGGQVETHWDGMIYLQEAWAMDPLLDREPCP